MRPAFIVDMHFPSKCNHLRLVRSLLDRYHIIRERGKEYRAATPVATTYQHSDAMRMRYGT
jgi:hypothetical protein